MLRFSSEVIDRNIVVTINNVKYLLNTGSPISFGNAPIVSIDGTDFSLRLHYPSPTTPANFPIVDSIMTIPVVQIGIADENHRLHFDTGAKLAYLHEDLL